MTTASFQPQHIDIESKRAFCTSCHMWQDFRGFHNRNDGYQPIWQQCKECKKLSKIRSEAKRKSIGKHLRREGAIVHTSTPKRSCKSGKNCVAMTYGPNPLPEPAKLSLTSNDSDYCAQCERREQDKDFEKLQAQGEFIEVNGKIYTKQQAEAENRQ